MSRNWTEAQLAAINTKNKTLLVSAAAGSGKTATLTERIIRGLTDQDSPADISKMLIVTFTRAAADELKSRIFDALSKALAKDPGNHHLTSQLIQLGNAKICTIDAFYLDLIRENFASLGLSASFRIADSSELEILASSVMEEVIDFFYETDEEFPFLAECFTGTRSADALGEVLLDLDSRVASIPEGVSFLRDQATKIQKQADQDFFSTDSGQLLRSHCQDITRYCLSVFHSACEGILSSPEATEAMLPSFSYDRDFCEMLISTLELESNGYAETQRVLDTFAPVRLKRLRAEFATEETEKFKALRSKLHEQLRDMKKKFFSKSSEHIRQAMLDTARITNGLYRVLTEYERRMTEEKQRRSILDFNDIRRYTLRLLVEPNGEPTQIARQYAEQFSEIYIDEYQDVDRVQDLIFRSIARRDNRFMVGDIKQSIYSFRGAEPQVFAEYRSALPSIGDSKENESDGFTIFMSENFRCDKGVIDFTNLICSRIFSVCEDSIGYQKQDDLVFSKSVPYDGYQAPKVRVSVIVSENEEAAVSADTKEYSNEEAEAEEALSSKELEAKYIALEIRRLIAEEKKADGTPILPGDIAVLFRSRSMSAYLVKALHAQGIQTSECDGDRYFENPDVLMVLCLLNTIDNPHRDIFLTGALRSPLFRFSMDDLILIRTAADASASLYDALLAYAERDNELGERCRSFDELLGVWRQRSRSLAVDRFLQMLFDSELFVASGFVNSQNELGEGGNLLRLYEYARTFEAGSFKGLYNFIEFINTLIEEGKKMKVPPKGTSSDRVNLMTMHQSKGLEFPVCFVCGTGNRFNKCDQYADLLFEYPVGIAMKIADTTGFAKINTPMREALAIHTEMRRSEEEMRVLYVALTRARERLYVTASCSATQEALMNRAALRAQFCQRYVLLRCNSYLDWILLPFADPMVDTEAYELCFFTEKALSGSQNVPKETQAVEDTACADKILLTELTKKYAFQYPYTHMRRIPAKLSVSRLSPNALDAEDRSLELFPTVKRTEIPAFFLDGSSSKASASERGTATHLFLQFFNLDYAREYGIKAEIARLTEKKFIPRNLSELIYVEEMERFLKSDLAKRMENAKQIIREQRFNILMPPEFFTEDSLFREQLKDEQMAVQGVVDLILVGADGALELYDYKTDRLTSSERQNSVLLEKKMNRLHGLQLSYYAHAVSLLFDRPCDRVAVYSTCAGCLVPIHVKKLLDTDGFKDIF